MVSEATNPVARALRIGLAGAALLIVLWSFYWVISRPLRQPARRAGQTEITVVHWGEKNEDRIVASLVRDFESLPENADIRIRRINLGQSAAVNTKLQTMFAAGVPPDVFYLDYPKVGDFASKEVLADIERLIAQDRAADVPTLDLNDFYKPVVDAFRYDAATGRIGHGKLVGLAKDFTTVGIYYNKDLFRRAGVPFPSADDWTWGEFHAAAEAIGKLPGCYGADFPTWEAMVRLWLWSHGLDFGTPGWEELRFTDPAVVAALARLQSWFHDGGRTLYSAKTQLETGLEPFLSGNVGMAGPYGRWKTPTYRLIAQSERPFDWDFAPLPHAESVPAANGVFTVGWAIAADSPHPDEAWRFVKYLNTPRAQALMSESGLAIPVLRRVAESESFSNPGQRPENWRAYLKMAEIARPIDFPAAPEYSDQLRVRLEAIFKLNRPVGEVLAALQADWERLRAAERKAAAHPVMPWGRVTFWIVAPALAALVVGGVIWWRRRPGRVAWREELAGYGLISPWVAGFAAFTAFPVVLSLLLTFTRWSSLTTLDRAQFVGGENLTRLLTGDASFQNALLLTAYYALLAVPSSQLVALAAALLMNRDWRGIGVFRAIWYLPSVLAGVGHAIMWKWVFHHEHGLINALLGPVLNLAELAPPRWLERDAGTWGVPVFAFINLWTLGGTMMIYLAGLKGVPRELYEAAAIDGATGWRRFRNVTLPLLSPVIFFNVIIAIIASFQVFTQAWVMTGGGPGEATRFYVVYLYRQAFDFHEMGYASAMAWLLLLIVLALTLVVMRGSRRFVYYEALRT